MDLIDMQRYQSKNRDYKYILTCIDVLLRYTWARILKNNTSKDVTTAMEDICLQAGGYPRILQRDNGAEDLSGS